MFWRSLGISILLCPLFAGCTDYQRECTLCIAVTDNANHPVSEYVLEMTPSSIVYPMLAQYKVSTKADGKAILKYMQIWANHSLPPDITWTFASGTKSFVMKQNAVGYFIITKLANDITVRSVSEMEFESVKSNTNGLGKRGIGTGK